MIRKIKPEDKEQVLRLVEMFFKERVEKTGVSYDEENAKRTFDLLVTRPSVLALCVELDGKIVGLIAGISSSILFAKELAMQELVWYVEPSNRKCGIRLLREFEKVVKSMGINYVMMVGMSGDPVLKFYDRVGYVETQRTFLKKV